MAYRNKTYVIFDGDNDIWAYRYMHGWIAQEHVEFNFHDVHDLGSEITNRAAEETVKRRLRERFSSAKQVIVLIGERTKFLYRFVRWELEAALDLDLPVVAVNLNGKRICDFERCPPIIRDEFVVPVPFKAKAIQLAVDNFPMSMRSGLHATVGHVGMVRRPICGSASDSAAPRSRERKGSGKGCSRQQEL